MRRLLFATPLLLSLGVWAPAVDLAKIDRQIARLPELESPNAKYCLLVFGPEATTRVWLVRDGDVLYVADSSRAGRL